MSRIGEIISRSWSGGLGILIVCMTTFVAGPNSPVQSVGFSQQVSPPPLIRPAGPGVVASLSDPIPLADSTASSAGSSAERTFPPDFLTPEESVNTSVYTNCNRSVVHIETSATKVDMFLTTLVREGTGSGSLIDNQGHILTNYHVIEGAKKITVSLFNGVRYPAIPVGQDADTDIAVIKIDAPPSDLYPIQWGESQNLKVGQRIYAIGNPFGLERTMSTGIISSLNRQIPSSQHRTMRSLIQIDCALNQGNSGGPLINTRSELIGMNTAIMSSNGDSAGVGFAIPVSTLRRIVPQLIRTGKIVRPTIGISRVYENNGGLMIVNVVPGGPADRAGLKGFSLATKSFLQGALRFEQTVVDPSSADQIVAADGKPVKTADELLAIIEEKRPNDVVEITVERSGKRFIARVTLGASN